ncbi:hypothetical protein DMB42_34120 [Nonomuraea sp. WAC 01424]|uniref:hypothetical protein n=1 Tax=Nonomuraea sp. WAC 01424 TaxID=2203200 RepID=UPI000F77FC41|nr:hypothetical protein [Nonomuraea sp. WAC 01424]RSN03725.1 hypothetical protein DMB42_34120 [Nonomuraea sp. WAC 01424]
MQEALTYLDQTFINFREFLFADHAHRWVDIKRFAISHPDVGDAHLLTELIGHEQFRDDYAGGGVEADGLRHGPYWLRNVSPAAYMRVDEMSTDTVLRDWATQFGPLPAALSARLEHEVHPLVAGATERYRLSGLGREAFHDWGGVHADFHELVLIDRPAKILSLLVAADD